MRSYRKNRKSILLRWVFAASVGMSVTTILGLRSGDAQEHSSAPLPEVVQSQNQRLPDIPIVAQAPDQRPPEIPETVVPGVREPATEAPETPPPPTPGPFGRGGVFNTNVQGPFLPDVQGTRIYDGKKTENIDLRQQPPIANNNLRQALITVPSLVLSEEQTPLVSIGYRGLAPDRAQFMLILKDGIPIQADFFGYPEAYYIPPFQVVDHIDFIHGGSALMYGPQPGGALNFITKMPVQDRLLSLYSENMWGSYNFFSTYNAASGTAGNLGYYVYGHNRGADGFRIFNSDYEVNYGGGKFVYALSERSRVIATFDLYGERHGEPGGLIFSTFQANPDLATRRNDRFELKRDAATATYQEAITDETFLEMKLWGVYYGRFSRRQRLGAGQTSAFGVVPTGTTSDFQNQQFYTIGFEPRVRHDYNLFDSDNQHTFTAGFMYYHTTSPRTDLRGGITDNAGNQTRTTSERQTDYLPFFAENLFRMGNLHVTPGIRLENIWQQVGEAVNVDKTAAGQPLGGDKVIDVVPLLGVGLVYKFTPNVEAYSNTSQSYRPILFDQAVVAPIGTVVAGNLQPGDAWQTDLGFRGNPTSYLNWDTSLFYMSFTDQIGQIGVGGVQVIQNVGDARYQGWEFSSQVDVVGLSDDLMETNNTERFGSLGTFYNLTLLNAEFTAGPAAGSQPQYAPPYIMKTGFTYNLRDYGSNGTGYNGNSNGSSSTGGNSNYDTSERLRIWFTGTFYANQFGNDNNTANFFIPSYKVWDLTAEAKVYRDYVRFFGGIYNVFDQRYFSRVVSTGIDPAFGRNFYSGFKVIW